MKKMFLFFIIGLSICTSLFSQENKKIEVKFHGFVKVDYFLDSRQTVAARAGHFLLFPKAADFDLNGADINATPSFNILAIQTRLKTAISGPDFYGAKSSAVIEGAFFGHSNADINGLRLRHAFIKLNWEHLEVLMGQYWNPMFVTKSFAGVYSFNTGAPFQPFSRNPQLRLTYGKDFKLLATIYSQRDFTSRGPEGASCEYLRNSAIPAMNFQVQYENGAFFGGAGVDYKLIRPILSLDGIKYEQNLPALSYIAFMKLKSGKSQIKLEGTFGENLADQLIMGGIAEYNNDGQTGFTNFKTLALWADLSTSLNNVELGLFGGYAKNLGTVEPLSGATYALGGDIDNLWRISLRSAIKSGPIKIGIELENTTAQYGVLEQGNSELILYDLTPVSNFRALLFAMYAF